MSARFYADLSLVEGAVLSLPDHAARHIQVLRLQPGEAITLFNGRGDGRAGSEGHYAATINRMGRSDVEVLVGAYTATRLEAVPAVHLVLGMPANERMDWLLEKATELGVASIQPLITERSVLRLKGDRADKKLAHWRGVAVAACEQCGRNRVPAIYPVQALDAWLQGRPTPNAGHAQLLLSLARDAHALADATQNRSGLTFLSGPEGGLSTTEEAAARAVGFKPVSLGARVLRAETAPLACLAFVSLRPGS